MQPLDRLALVAAVLCREAVELCHAERFELGKMITERARLRGAAARPRDRVPAIGRRLPWHAGTRIDVDDGAALELRQVNLRAVGRSERHGRQLEAGKMAGSAIVLRH